MTGTLSQIVTITTFGNDFLINNKLHSDFSDNLSFKFCNKVDFRIIKWPVFFLKKREKVIAQFPNDWFRYLKENECIKLRLCWGKSVFQSDAKDYKLAGLVGGGGIWVIKAVYKNHSELWSGRWDVTQRDDPNQNIWTVNYVQTRSGMQTMDLQISQQKSKEELDETLKEIEAFAYEQDLEFWGKQFTEARKALISSEPEKFYYNKDLIPLDNYSLVARQILYAAGTAWVFGAMGSWNDLGFDSKEKNEKYESLSEKLYEIVNQAIIAAVNSY